MYRQTRNTLNHVGCHSTERTKYTIAKHLMERLQSAIMSRFLKKDNINAVTKNSSKNKVLIIEELFIIY